MVSTLVEKLEENFEILPVDEREVKEPQTLAEAVSNSLLSVMPRISPKLFDVRRKANVKIYDKVQKEIISRSFCDRGFRSSQTDYENIKGYDLGYTIFDKNLKIKAMAEIPRFFYGIFPQEEVTIPNCLDLTFFINKKFSKIAGYTLSIIERYKENNIENKDIEKYHSVFGGRKIEIKDRGKLSLNFEIKWEAPFKLNVSARIPDIPGEFIELGDESIAVYYDYARKVPSELRKKTKLETPNIGILWAPTDSSLYCTGTKKIPNPKLIPQPKKCPVLVLDIPYGEKSYRHAVAAWNIGEELPFKDWIQEFSEGRINSNLGG